MGSAKKVAYYAHAMALHFLYYKFRTHPSDVLGGTMPNQL